MKKIISLMLSGAMMLGIFSGIAATPQTSPQVQPVKADAPATAELPIADPLVQNLFFEVNADKTPVYFANNDKVALYANKGFKVAATAVETKTVNGKAGEKAYFEMGYNSLTAPVVKYYIDKTALSDAEPSAEPMPAIISGDTIVLKKNAKLYNQEGKQVATNCKTSDRFFYVLKDDKGYNFQFGGNYLYVSTKDASVKAPIDGSKELAKILNADKKVKTITTQTLEKLPAGMTYYSIVKKLGATKDTGSGLHVASYGVKGKPVTISFANPFEICKLDGKTILANGNNGSNDTENGDESAKAPNVMTGTIKELYEDNSFLFAVKDGVNQDEVVVRYESAIAPKIAFTVGMALEIEHNGIMTRSIPAQMSAMKIIIADSDEATVEPIKNTTLSGTIVGVDEKETSFTFNTKEMGDVVVHYGDAKAPRIAFAKGQKVTVEFNGATTMSLPPQISAIAITID